MIYGQTTFSTIYLIGMESASMEWWGLGAVCYGYWIFVNIFSIFFSLYLQVEKLNTKQSYSGFILKFLNIIYSQITPFAKMIVLLQTQTFSPFPTMPYSVIMIVAMLTCQSACGCVSKDVESLTICFLIFLHLYIIINRQTSRYLVGYFLLNLLKSYWETRETQS